MGKQDILKIGEPSEPAQPAVGLRDINEQLLISVLREQELAAVLENERARLEVILDSIGDAVLVVDSTGTPVLTNAAYARLMGDPNNVLLLEETTGELLPVDKAPWHQAAQGETFTVEFSTISADGTRHWWEANGRPVGHAPQAQGGVVVIRDVTAYKRLAKALHHQALHDGLTGLPNRTLLYDRLDRVLRSADRTLDPLALFVMDLDRFKEVNDTLGHHAGDLMLQEIAARLIRTIRAADTVARLGGDEFAVLLPKTDHKGAVHVAHRIRASLGAAVIIDGQAVEVAASIGIVIWSGRGARADTLMKQADLAMYEAKRTKSGHAVHMNEFTSGRPQTAPLTPQPPAAPL